MHIIKSINDAVNSVVWGVPMLILIIGTGIYFSFRLGFFQVSKFRHILSSTIFSAFGKKKEQNEKALTPFQAMSTALAATIGTGNIAGVASAVAIGGAGAVFWMWVSAFFGMMTSFAENVLGVYYRKKNKKGEWSGGAMYYISEGLKNKKLAKVLAVLFSAFCVLASFGIGNMAQVNSIATSLENAFNIPPLAVGIVLAVIVGFILIGGVKRIGSVAEKIVPFMAMIYILFTLCVVILNIKAIPEVLSSIFKGAFGFDAVAGGISGALIKNAMTLGFKRGVFSNEAGLGSGVIVNSTADVKEPVEQGMWGVFEVFFDTIVVCTLTAFTVLSTGVHKTSSAEGASLVGEAFSQVFSSYAGAIVAVSITLFAFTTVLGWAFYGSKCLEYLFGGKSAVVYKIIFSLMLIVGSTMNLTLALEISDTLNALMAIPNLIGVLLLSGTVVKITRNYSDRKFKNKKVSPMLSAYTEIQFEMEK
ncbi:MAG: alanine:cation symporter family protein [Ruminococcaceae bacterium]|nr:alanine:cation symporter family protein [Oscillospiraceae bacterium]